MNTDDLIVELGKRVLKIRQKLSISQSDLAERAELSKTYLGEFERGQRTNISISVIARIADSLGVTMSELFDDIERSGISWENDDTFTNTLYQKKMEDACYPPALEGVPVSTLMQFLVYLPLLQPRYIIDSLLRIDGTFNGYESYVLKQINFCISKIPPSPAKGYADNCAKQLCRDEYMKSKYADNLEVELGKGYEEYISKIKQLDTFFKCYRMMTETGV